MPTQSLYTLRDRHAGETGYIVGKGPSLLCLEDKHFGPGPILCINESILAVEELKLDNPLYSLQKDGYRDHMVLPRGDTTLILQRQDRFGHYSGKWYPQHPKRILVDPVTDMGFEYQEEMSIRMAIWLARYMGAGRIAFVSCDNLVNGSLERVRVRRHTVDQDFEGGGYYLAVREQVLEDVRNIPHVFITPGQGKEIQ